MSLAVASAPAAAKDPFGWVALASCAAGALIGALNPTAQVAVEPAQLLAGLVEYPPGNPFALYELRLWTLWHQVLALLLAAGLSERVLSIAVSGAVGAIAWSGLAILALGAGARPLVAISVPFVLAQLGLEQWGFQYPILLLGKSHTYGMAGLGWLVLVSGLWTAGRFRAAAFLLGLAPAMHASLGSMYLAVVGIAALFGPRELRTRGVLVAGACGLGLAVASFVIQRAVFPVEAHADPAEAARYLGAFVRLWDPHRRPLELADRNVWYFACAALFAAILLLRGGAAMPTARRFGLRVFALCALFGAGANLAIALAPRAWVPDALVIAMPTRFLNLPLLALLPWAIGVADARRGLWSRLLLVAAPASALLHRVALVEPAASFLLCALVLPVAIEASSAGARDASATDRVGRRWTGLEWAATLLLAAAVALPIGISVRAFPKRLFWMRDSSNDEALAAAARGQGLVAAGSGVYMVQLRTRRPVLLDPEALDMLPYAIAGASALERSLREVYAIDFFRPPPHAIHGGVVPLDPVRRVWEQRTQEGWIELGARHGIREVLVRSGWTLRLPEVARSRFYALYRIPEPARTGEPPLD